MAAMPFPYDGILVFVGNLRKIFPMSSFHLVFTFTGNGPALCFKKFGNILFCVKCCFNFVINHH